MDAQLTIVDVTGSTNDDLLEAGKQGAPHGTGLAARAQTAGRGRRGHKWDSTAGNLLLSIVLRPCVNPAKYSGLAAVSGSSGARGARKAGSCKRDWPQMAQRPGRAEDASSAAFWSRPHAITKAAPFAVCGIGVNVNYAPSGGARWRPAGNRPLGPQRERSRRRRAPQGGLSRRRRRCGRVGRTASTAMEENTGPLAPVHGEYVAHLNWIGEHVIARSPAGDETGARHL